MRCLWYEEMCLMRGGEKYYYEQSVTSTCVYGHGVSKSKPKKHVCTWLTIPLNNRLYDRIKSRSRPPIVLKCRARSSCTLLVTHRIRAIWLKPAWLLHSHISYLFTTKYILHYQLHRKWERNFCSKWKVHARNIFRECFFFHCKIIHAMKMGEVKWKTIHQWCNCILLCMHFLLLHLMDNQSIAINDTAILSLCQRNNNHAAFDAHRHYQVGDWTCKYELNVQHVNVVFCIYLICCIDCAIGDTRSTL